MKSKSVWILLIVAAILLAGSFFLPYASVDKETRKSLNQYPDQMYMAEIEMTNRQSADLALVEFFKMYSYISGNMSGNAKDIATLCVALMGVMAGITVLILLFALTKKPIPIVILSILNIGIAYLFSWDLKDRGVIDGAPYSFSVAYYLIFILLALLAVGSIVAKVLKKKEKVSIPA